MNKAVLMSIKPEWCELIAKGRKTVEVRKTRPKGVAPFKCYIYCTKWQEKLLQIIKDGEDIYGDTYRGKPIFVKTYAGDDYFGWRHDREQMVIGEFVCDWCDKYELSAASVSELALRSLVLPKDLREYAGEKGFLYGWHISELEIYDKPKPITDFKRWNRTEENAPCAHTKWLYEPCETCKSCNLKRAPQSWCYVEELKDG